MHIGAYINLPTKDARDLPTAQHAQQGRSVEGIDPFEGERALLAALRMRAVAAGGRRSIRIAAGGWRQTVCLLLRQLQQAPSSAVAPPPGLSLPCSSRHPPPPPLTHPCRPALPRHG